MVEHCKELNESENRIMRFNNGYVHSFCRTNSGNIADA